MSPANGVHPRTYPVPSRSRSRRPLASSPRLTTSRRSRRAGSGSRCCAPADRLGYGSLLAYRLELFRVPIHWLTRISTWHPPRRLCRRADLGPVSALGAHARLLRDGRRHGDLTTMSATACPAVCCLRSCRDLSSAGGSTEIFDYRAARPRGDSRMTSEPCPVCGAEAANTVGPVYGGAKRTLWRSRSFEERLYRCEEGHVYAVRTEDGEGRDDGVRERGRVARAEDRHGAPRPPARPLGELPGTLGLEPTSPACRRGSGSPRGEKP
jgi:hypothetical protein